MVSPGEQRRAWAYALISRAATPPPAYGSTEWLALSESSAEKVAAVVLAAEKCLLDWEAEKAHDDQVFKANSDEHRRQWTGRGFRADPFVKADVEREWRDWTSGAA